MNSPAFHAPRRPRIAVVGAGLGGLTCARVLHVHGMDAVVHEREPSRATRGQGGMLDLHPEGGQRALREAGLEAAFRAVARPEGQDLRLLEPDGTLLLRQDTPDDAPLTRPEVDRGDLRDLLLDSLPPETVVWGRAFRHATALPGGGHRLHFADGGHADHALLVGADSAGSRVRSLVTDARPAHTGVNMVEIGIPDADRTRPELAAMVGRGNYWVIGGDRSLAAQRNGDGRIRIHLSFRTPGGLVLGLRYPLRARRRGPRRAEGPFHRLGSLGHGPDRRVRRHGRTTPGHRPARRAELAGHVRRHAARRRGAPHAAGRRGRQPGHARRGRTGPGSRRPPRRPGRCRPRL
ncbi:hypothetical protein GCM10022232_28000 [Streptomyces plumbiresistens]|uniref:FAD dependent oxidoreductase domain-containing protein n=1 Tax=Streptomyces plumbiresistens TaxID=511811 RepID=A0ABP7R2V8_9ACTN